MRQSIFSVVKENVTALKVAEMYGLKVDRKGMACCPFHTDRTPSMKVDRRYYCFGCGATGDAVDLAAHMLGLDLKDAANRIIEDLGMSADENTFRKNDKRVRKKARADPQKEASDWIMKSVRMLIDHRAVLDRWERIYAPEQTDEEWHPLFCEALKDKDRVEYLMDELLLCSKDQFIEMRRIYGKEVKSIERKLERSFERERRYHQRDKIKDDSDRERADQTDDEQLSAGHDRGSGPGRSIPYEQTDGKDRHRKKSWMEER